MPTTTRSLGWTEEQEMLRDSVRRSFPLADAHSAQWGDLAQGGLLMAGVAEEYGGMGTDVAEQAAIADVLGANQIGLPYLACGVFVPALLAAAGRGDLLEKTMEGSLCIAFAGTLAPTFDGDLLAMESGSLTGTVPVATGVPLADQMIVFADGSLHLVDKGAEGITANALDPIDGIPAAALQFENAGKGCETIIAGEPALEALKAAEMRAAIVAVADMVGAADAALWQTRDYLKERRQFGSPLSDFQTLQHRMADMYIALEQARSIVFAAIDQWDSGSDSDARALAVHRAVDLTRRNATFITSQAIQLHGGIGTTEELPVGRYYKRVLAASALLGPASGRTNALATLLARRFQG